MKKTIYLVSAIFLLFSCASTPENKTPVDESIVKLHKAKEIQCSFTKGVRVDSWDLEVEKHPEGEDDDEIHLQIKIDPKSNNATTYRYNEGAEDPYNEDTYNFASKMQKWERGISFIVYVEGWFIETITVFNIEDIPSDYGATLSISEINSDPAVMYFWGSCKVVE